MCDSVGVFEGYCVSGHEVQARRSRSLRGLLAHTSFSRLEVRKGDSRWGQSIQQKDAWCREGFSAYSEYVFLFGTL